MMETAEAEKVISAIAFPLKWESTPLIFRYGTHADIFEDRRAVIEEGVPAWVGGRYYRMYRRLQNGKEFYCAMLYRNSQRIDEISNLPSRIAAEMACARHHETGRWK